MVLIQLLLPTRVPGANGPQHTEDALAETGRELADAFDGPPT